jgi:pyridinium-3,5-bisthiocarboxylic acid mononucleotide nickel chelatase
MSILYLDPIGGIAGDMLCASLIDLGLDVAAWKAEIEKLGLDGYSIEVSKTMRGVFSATHLEVVPTRPIHASAEAAEGPHPAPWERHHRTWRDIDTMIRCSQLQERSKEMALATFAALAEAEGLIHGCPPEQVHFHEVGALDSIIDIVGACVALEQLGVRQILCGALPMSSGEISGAHGRIPLPAPATLALLDGWPTRPGQPNHEHVTPTGAAILSALARPSGYPAITVSGSGFGAGGRNPSEYPNLLRAVLGEENESSTPTEIIEMHTQVDDMSGEELPMLLERLLEAGALDAYAHPILMKKGRSGLLVTALCTVEKQAAVETSMLENSTSFGIRFHPMKRKVLERSHRTIQTEWGEVRMKLGTMDGKIIQASVEYEDAADLARRHKLPLRRVLEEAKHRWRQECS